MSHSSSPSENQCQNCHEPLGNNEVFCSKCGAPRTLSPLPPRWSEPLSTDYKGRCGNCHRRFHGSEPYCRYCGTKRGEGSFEPYSNVMPCIYGPPPRERVRHCPKCGALHRSCSMLDDSCFCPYCGTPTDLIEEGNAAANYAPPQKHSFFRRLFRKKSP